MNEEVTIESLKAQAYDLYNLILSANNQLAILNKRIAEINNGKQLCNAPKEEIKPSVEGSSCGKIK